MASCSFSGWVYVVKDVASRFEGQPVPSVPSGGSFGGATATGSQVLPRFMALVQQTDQSCVLLYKRDPQTAPQEEPTFSGVVREGTLVEVLGRRVLPQGQVLHVFSVSSGGATVQRGIEIGCSTAEAAHQWVSVLEAAASQRATTKVQATVSAQSSQDGDKSKLARLQSHGSHISIGGGARTLALQGAPFMVGKEEEDEKDVIESISWRLIKLSNGLRIFEGVPLDEVGVSEHPRLLKAEGIVEAEPDRIFEVLMDLSPTTRCQWDVVTVDAKVVEVIDGFTDIVVGVVASPGAAKGSGLREMKSKRTWRRNPDGSYVISMINDTTPLPVDSTTRVQGVAYSWDIVPLVAPGHIAGASGLGGASGPYARSLVSYVLEATGTLAAIGTGSASSSVSQFLNKKKNISLPFFKSSGEEKDKERKQSKEREKERSPSGGALVSVPSTHVGAALPAPVLNATTVETWAEGLPFASMQRIAGLREYFASQAPVPGAGSHGLGAPSLPLLSLAQNTSDVPLSEVDYSAPLEMVLASQQVGNVLLVGGDEFYDALESSIRDEEDTQKRGAARKRWQRLKWLLRFGILIQSAAETAEPGVSWCVQRELLHNVPPVDLAALGERLSQAASVPKAAASDSLAELQNAWRDPGGTNFCVRGPTYLEDRVKVPAGEPLLKLVAMDWFTDDARMDNVAARPGCLAQSEAGKALPFLFVVNLQVPGPPWYSLVAYFASDRPIRAQPQSLLHRFYSSADDSFRNARFKLIPRIAEGHWMVKRAVGTKACILGKALKCTFTKGANFLEMDCDIGSSSVARNIIGLVISYVTTLVVDLTFLIEAQEPEELPEYLLGAFTCIHMDTKKAVAPPPDVPAAGGADAASGDS